MYNQGMNKYNILYMGMSGNVTIFLEYQAMFLENCVIHYILSIDIKAAKEFT